ncbi:asparagine synthase (glutamine-hydrolyzing) [Streptomyces sp. NPDC051211]|uniref:asparagine synthase (glutamine-hydrolyzing) n=1 Tax=Streptomyces sp. NPDC051211 TaxID=3154643 RepID=UPI00344B6313
MCGLAGIAVLGATESRSTGRETDAVGRMLDALNRRGPDGRAMVSDESAVMGFTRLALVAPKDGDQPFVSADGQIVLMANGEVYNHRELEAALPDVRLRTKSDCEILLHLYERKGLDFLDDVRGMFAVVIHDRRHDRIVFARDRFGIKPIYHTISDGRLVFASELKAIARSSLVDLRFDWDAALHNRQLSAEPSFARNTLDSFVVGVHATPAATIETIDLRSGAMTTRKYWELPDFSGSHTPAGHTPGHTPGHALDGDLDRDFVAEYRSLVAASVADCATADADVGLLLSGGLDSAAVAALAATQGKTFTAFSAVTPGTLMNGDAQAAQLLAGHLGVDLRLVALPPRRHATAEEWLQLLAGTETPFCGPEQWFKHNLYIEAKRTNPALKAMLLGQAADEFNGGYATAIAAAEDWATFEQALHGMDQNTRLLSDGRLAGWQGGAGSYLRSVADGDGAHHYADFVRTKYEDIQQYNNWHEDRVAAMHGVEARVPFLDHRIVELLGRIPRARHAELLWDKTIARQAFQDVLPAGLAHRPKISFYRGTGEGLVQQQTLAMLTGDRRALLERALDSAGGKEHLRPDAVLSAVERAVAGDRGVDVDLLMRLVNMALLDDIVASGFAGYELDPPAYSTEEPALVGADLTASRHSVLVGLLGGPDTLLHTAPGVDFARSDDDRGTFVIVDGAIEYTVDDDERWIVELLRAAEQPVPLTDLVDGSTGPDRTRIEEQVDELVAGGLLRCPEVLR